MSGDDTPFLFPSGGRPRGWIGTAPGAVNVFDPDGHPVCLNLSKQDPADNVPETVQTSLRYQGIACALAALAATSHSDPTILKDVLDGLGLDLDDLQRAGADPDDLLALAEGLAG